MPKKWIGIAVGLLLAIGLLFAGSVAMLHVVLGDALQMSAGDGVGLVEVRGMILDSRDVIRQLREFRKNTRVKAIVLRIDTPGGVVGPSQEISEEVKKLAAVKKVVVSMGSVAASGGYYIAAPATTIFANPGTITGSIGVLMKFSNVEGLLGKVGMKSFTLKSGPYKDAGSPVRPMTAEERAVLQGVIDSTHAQFVRAVAEGRKLPVEEVRRIADGRILSGEQALALKLVDKMGNQQDAIEEAGRLAGIKGEPTVIIPAAKKKKLVDLLVEETSSKITGMAGGESGLSVQYQMGGGLLLGQ
jgi:protease-4